MRVDFWSTHGDYTCVKTNKRLLGILKLKYSVRKSNKRTVIKLGELRIREII